MHNDDGQDLHPGDHVNVKIDEATDIELGQENVLYEGDYMIYVPRGQKAIVRYELAATEGETNEMDSDSGVVFNASDG